MAVDEWIAKSRPRIAALAAVSILVILTGFLQDQRLAARANHRIETGMPTSATVIDVETVYRVRASQALKRVIVEYSVDGKRRNAGLMSGFNSIQLRRGDVITLYLDPADPAKSATKTGLLSEGTLTLVAPTLYAIGMAGMIMAIIALLVNFLKGRKRSEGYG